MSEGIHTKTKLDPRAGLFLLIISNIITFFQNSLWIEIGYLLFLGMLYVIYGYGKENVKWLTAFLIILLLQYKVLPAIPSFISTGFYVLANYSRRMFPCLMAGALLIKKVSLHELITALRQLKLPQQLIIAVSVTLRYFPAIKEEIVYHWDAVRLRNVSKARQLEALLVPLMISATETAEELSAAAVTRGIENPGEKTSVTPLKITHIDYIHMGLATLFAILSIMIR